MKRPVLKPAAFCVTGLFLVACLLLGPVATRGQGSGSSAAPPTLPSPAKNPAADSKPVKTGKGQSNSKQASKEIPIVLPIGEIIRNIAIPQNNATGQELSKLIAMKMKRLDDDHMEIEGMRMNLNKPDGKTDFFIEVPTSVFNLKTRVIHSDNPIKIRTQDFELSGEKMEFDTVERTGKLLGRVEMRIHNLKQVAGQSDENANE